jgi:hypothetical protein
MHLYIKNMVCNRCIMVVRHEFEKAGFKPWDVKMWEVELNKFQPIHGYKKSILH